MTREDALVVRESRTTAVIALCVCVILLGVGSFSTSGAFHFAAIGFMILITIFIILILWLTSFITVFTSTGINGKSFGKRWNYSWEQVESWGLDYFPNGEYSIWFKTKGAKKRHYIQALGDDIGVKAQEYFKRYFGNSLGDEQDREA